VKRKLFSILSALALTGALFAQAGNQDKTQDKKSKDDTNFQKGNPDPTDPAKQPKDDPKKGKDKTGKNKKGPIDPNDPAKGNGPTVPTPTPAPTPTPTK
jgi:hypothetical protein